jgi:hypothetical protein
LGLDSGRIGTAKRLLGRAGRQHRGRCNLPGGGDIPYEEGFTYRVAVDGFIVSDNVTATAENINAGFAYSDNNPVKLTFTLAAQ